jgi:hypothetical protein
LYEDFKSMCDAAGSQVILFTVEVAFGERAFVVTTPDNSLNLQLRTTTELWFKENLINIAINHLPQDAEFIAWVDGDVIFLRPDWGDETVHQLQHYQFVQMWSQYEDLNSDGEIMGTAPSFMDNYVKDKHVQPALPGTTYPYYWGPGKPGYPGAPGLAWAARKSALSAVGGLIDIAILGACDWYMSHALVGRVEDVIRKDYHPSFRDAMLRWQELAERHIRRNVGVVTGCVAHYFHGPKRHRKYGTRDQILIDTQFDPIRDLKRDHQGLFQLVDHGEMRDIQLRDGIRKYFRGRFEDDPSPRA